MKRKTEGGELAEKINILDKIVNMISKYGIKRVVSALLIFMLFIATSIVFINQKAIINKLVTAQKEVTQTNEVKRMEFRVKVVNPIADAILYELMAKTKCDRAFIIEMHNGTDNPSGLPFVYGDITYEKILNDTTESIISQNEKLNLSTVPMASYLYVNKRFLGSVDVVKKIDPNLARKMRINGDEYIAIYSIRGGNVELGGVGITFNNRMPDDGNINKIEGCLLDASQRLSILLDINSNIKEE